MYKRTTINESVQPRFLDIEEFMTYTSLGRTSAMRLGKEIGCTMRVGRRVLYDRSKIMQKENRNNRVHTGEQSGKTDFLIERLLPVGKENAITTQDLVKLSGCGSARELQQRIAYEREQGAIICSGSGRGYWRPKDRQEIQEFVHTMNARALNTLKAVKSAKRALKVPEGQQSMNGGNEDGK